MVSHSSSNNTISSNDFLTNRMGSGSQACDNNMDNIFTNNYWNDWTEPDNDHDGIVDEPYKIDGSVKNQDAYPLAAPCINQSVQILFSPRITYPNGREKITESKSPLVNYIEQTRIKTYLEESISLVANLGRRDTTPNPSTRGKGNNSN
jgi:nitrous oxidase accessory protein NosD